MTVKLSRPDNNVSFLNARIIDTLQDLDADFVILGVPYGMPYNMEGVHNSSSVAPGAIRKQSTRFGYGRFLDHWDFDLDGPLLASREIKIVDAGDVAGSPLDIPAVIEQARQAVSTIRASGAIPVVLGGDDSIPIPVLRGFEGEGPITLVQIDAHIDWRDELHGVREGYSSPMRRASEMAWIGDMIQIGMRGVGSARPSELNDALEYGVKIVRARDVHRSGVDEAVLRLIPEGRPCFITIDCDGLDPSIMPAVGAPAPGGLLYDETIEILHGILRRAPLVGMSLVELTPARDINGLSALTATRLILNVIGAAARAGDFDSARSRS